MRVSPPVGLRGALSAIGIFGDHCGLSVSGKRCSQRLQYRHRQCRKGVLRAVCEGELQHRPYLISRTNPFPCGIYLLISYCL
ncbi:hypothetical protein Taro_003861 [Colocasia esculenta]|uniref:Uncharacterized protein n=1 Tax=Colocasia esculenta TaxID=4460 RepID=A0A843TGQ6_COLES|nr:hypothetical protein [Colocasia esculenta]